MEMDKDISGITFGLNTKYQSQTMLIICKSLTFLKGTAVVLADCISNVSSTIGHVSRITAEWVNFVCK